MNNEQCLNDLKVVFDELLKSNASVLTLEVEKEISDVAMHLYNSESLDSTEQEELKVLLMIANIMYNRTDMLVLPVEDGVYDELLEKYKKYDSNFQVGSAVVQFKAFMEEQNPEIKEIKPAIYFIKEPKRDEVRQMYKEKLQEYDRHKYIAEDYLVNPIYYTDTGYISKREHNTKHNHPQLVGTLDKCKFALDSDAKEMGVYDDSNVKILERDFFCKHIAQGIFDPNQEIELVVELKYDGISVEADCDHEVQSARTRGDTGIGEASDITPILKGYQFHRNNIVTDHTIGVKFEAIMTKDDLYRFNIARNYNYANCRTAIIGLFGASDANLFRDYITLVPLAVDRNQVPEIHNRLEEIAFCNNLFQSNGEPLRSVYMQGTYTECLYMIKKFAEEAEAARDYLNFMFDGIVVSYLDEDIRNKLGRENYINKFSMAVKFNPLSKLTRFLGYTYEVGQNGAVCPMIHYSPVEFMGAIHDKSTGSSYKRFKELNLHVGDVIKVTYVNDVMPYVTSIDCEQNRLNKNPAVEFPTKCPECGQPLVLSDSGKTAICNNPICPGKIMSKMVNMLQKLNIKGFAEATIKALNVFSFYDFMNMKECNISEVMGPIGTQNLLEVRRNIINGDMMDYELIGALGFTGVAAQKWKLIFSRLTLVQLVKILDNDNGGSLELLSNISGIGPLTAQTIANEYGLYKKDIRYIIDNIRYKDTKSLSMSGKQIRFTGCRNLQLVEQVSKMGHDISGDSGVTKKTDILIVPYKGFVSSKTSKVSDKCLIVAIDDFKANLDYYLSR